MNQRIHRGERRVRRGFFGFLHSYFPAGSAYSAVRSFLFLGVLACVFLPTDASAQVLPKVTVGFEKATSPEDAAVTLEILFMMTILTLAPSILILMTSFTRIAIVLSFLRRAIGTQTLPPNQLVMGLALFLTFFIMAPVFYQINDTALQPYLKKEIGYQEGLNKAMSPLRTFMLKQVKEKDLALFIRLAKLPDPKNVDDVPTRVVIPAFVTSELKTAFIIGFVLYVPFLVIDMVVASVLLSMGMMMLPPVMISLPFKLILFVLVDGWNLTIQELVNSFN
jgi:flagellar biosynthetic protein FliP